MLFLQVAAAWDLSVESQNNNFKVKYCFRGATPPKLSFAQRPNCNGDQLPVLSCVLLDRTHDMIGSVYPITSEDMSAI